METVAFYSYKGGVGRTLLLANTARFLALSGRKVVALDLDLEAPGLHYKLGSDLSERAAQGKLRGAVDELLSTLLNGAREGSIRDTAITIDLPIGCSGALWLIPAGSAPNPGYWNALERLSEATRAPDSTLLEAVLDLQARIAAELQPDFLLLDSRTGVTELSGLATSIVADRVVCMTNTTPESVDGIRTVAEALRQAPRLPDQRPIRIEFLVTRVDRRVRNSSIEKLQRELGDSVQLLPHDAEISVEEWTLGQGTVARSPGASSRDEPLRVQYTGRGPDTVWTGDVLYESPSRGELFSATLSWIARAFPGHAAEAAAAERRMLAVRSLWQELTRHAERIGDWVQLRRAWPLDRVREGVRFSDNGRSRQADLVAYDDPPSNPGAKPLMVIEYVEGENLDDVARWWRDTTAVPIAALVSDRSHLRLYSQDKVSQIQRDIFGRWTLPLPRDFEILSDPTDHTVEALLDSVRRGYPDYLDDLVMEWVRCSAAAIHPERPGRLVTARRILDALAEVDHLDWARHILFYALPSPGNRARWLAHVDDLIEAQVMRELSAPLCWRLPTEASIQALMAGRPYVGAVRLRVVDLLARELLGLTYEPDALFRLEGQRIPFQDPESAAKNPGGIYSLHPSFGRFEISFEWAAAPSPLLRSKPGFDVSLTAALEQLVAERVSDQALVTTGLLSEYEPATGRVTLYKHAIEQVAQQLSLRPRHLGSVTLLHETIHALMHLGRDLDGQLWDEHAESPEGAGFVEPGHACVALAQYFTYKQLLSLRDEALLHAFEKLSDHQPPSYRAWRQMKDVSIEQARQWLMSLRRGTGELPAFLIGAIE